MADTLEDINSFISRKAKEHGVDEDLVYSVIKHESGGNPKAMSGVGARGLMQLMPETAKSLGVKDSSDPYQNVEGGIKYLSQLQKKYKDPALTVAAYNAGPGNVDKYKGIPPFKETQNYAKNVTRTYQMAKARKGDESKDISPYDPFSLPAYGNDDNPSAPLTPKKEIKTIKKRGIEKFEEELAPENNFNYEPQWSRAQKAGRAIDGEFGDLVSQLSPEGRKKFEEQVKKPFIKKFEDITPLSEDLARGARVAAQSTVRALPQAVEDLQNTARFLTGGEKSIVPKADYVKNILPELASEEERAKRIPEQIVGGIPAYVAGGAALKTVGAIPKVASIINKIPSAVRTAGALALPVAPVEGLVKNVAQGITGGAQAAVSQAVKENQDPSLANIGTAAGQSGALTAATILAGKGAGKAISTITNKAIQNRIKPRLEGDVKPGSIAEEALNKFRQPQATETVTGKIIDSTTEGLVPKEYNEGPVALSRKTGKPIITKEGVPKVLPAKVLPRLEGEPTGNPYEGSLAPKDSSFDIEGNKKYFDDNLPKEEVSPQVKTPVEDISNIEKSVEVETPTGKAPVSQARINQRADELLDTPSSRGETYKDILTNDENYGPEVQKQIHDELLAKAKQQAAQERAAQRKEYNYDSQPASNKRYIDEGLNELDQLEYRQRTITSKGEEPSYILRDKINLVKKELQTSSESGKPGRPPKDVWLKERYGETQTTPYDSNVKENVVNRFKSPESQTINKKNLAKKLGVKNFIKEESGEADIESTGAPALGRTAAWVAKQIDSALDTGERLKKNPNVLHTEPLRIFEQNKLGHLAQAVRDMTGNLQVYFRNVEEKMLNALADIKIEESSYPKLKDALNTIKADDLITGNVTNNALWDSMTAEEKAWTHIIARFFRESADHLGMTREDYVSNYFPRMLSKEGADLDPILSMLLKKRKNVTPGIMHERKAPDEIMEFSNNVPEVVMRYANLVRRQILLGVVGEGIEGAPGGTIQNIGDDRLIDSAFRAAWKQATEENNQPVLDAIRQVRENLLQVGNTNLSDDIINQGMRNFVENTLKQSISAGLLNLTQTPTLLMAEVGVKNYIDSIFALLIDDDKTIANAIRDNVDLNQYTGAKYDLQRSISEGLVSPQTSFDQYKAATKEKVLIDAFGSPEKYLNQPLALISGMIKAAGGKKQLITALKQIEQQMQSPDAATRQIAIQAKSHLIGEGMKINQRTNFVRMQADRPNYESSETAKKLLPLLNYPIKEAGWNLDKFYELVVNPPGSEGRLNAARALTTYLFMKGLFLGPKAAAGLYVPSVMRSFIRDQAPDIYAEWEDKMQDVDDKFMESTGRGSFDFGGTGSLLDLSDPGSLNSPVLQQGKNLLKAPGILLDRDKDLSEKIKPVGDIAKVFIKAPSINVGKYDIPTGIGQTVEGIRAGVNANKGTRKVGKQEHKTDLWEEAKSLIGPLKETQAVYKEKRHRQDAVEMLRKGSRPSKTQVREITRAKHGDENASSEDSQIDTLDSLQTGALKKVKKAFDKAYFNANETNINTYAKELNNLGLEDWEIEEHIQRVIDKKEKEADPDTIEKKREKVEALAR